MNSTFCSFLLLACLLMIPAIFSPAAAGVLRYEDPWSRPNNYRQLPATQDNEAASDVFNMFENQEDRQEPFGPETRPKAPDRTPVRFDTYEDQWYNRM